MARRLHIVMNRDGVALCGAPEICGLNCSWSFGPMKKLKSALLLAVATAALSFGTANVNAQGNFDPAEMRQRMMDRVREQLDVKSDDEWKVISERVEKVMTARRDVPGGFGRGPGGGGGGGRRGGGDNANAAGGNGGNGGGERQNRFRGMFGEESQESKDLRAAVEAKAPAEELKAKLEKFRAYKKKKEAELAATQEKLKEVLNARQEAAAVMAGLLN
jgi:hypothetical protein